MVNQIKSFYTLLERNSTTISRSKEKVGAKWHLWGHCFPKTMKVPNLMQTMISFYYVDEEK
jgi:hypothetical protein